MFDLKVTSVSEEGGVTKSRIGDFELTADTEGAAGPDPPGVLLADYASSYVAALRAAAREHGVDGLGRVRVDVTASRDEAGDLSRIRFRVAVAAALAETTLDTVTAAASERCRVGAALRDPLRARVSAEADAFDSE